MKVWVGILSILVIIAGFIIYPALAKIDDGLSGDLQTLKQILKQRNLSDEQISRIIKTIKGLNKYLPENKVKEIIKAYMRDGAYVYTVFSPEEQEEIKKLIMKVDQLF